MRDCALHNANVKPQYKRKETHHQRFKAAYNCPGQKELPCAVFRRTGQVPYLREKVDDTQKNVKSGVHSDQTPQ